MGIKGRALIPSGENNKVPEEGRRMKGWEKCSNGEKRGKVVGKRS